MQGFAMNLFKNTRGKIREGFGKIPSKFRNCLEFLQPNPNPSDSKRFILALVIERFQSAPKIVARIRVKLGPKNLNTLGFRGRKER